MDIGNISIYIPAGVAGAVLWFLRWFVTRWERNEAAKREAEIRIAERQIMALDRIGVNVNDHTTKDLAHHAEVKETVILSIANLDKSIARIDERLKIWTTDDHPSERRRKATAAKGVQVG